VGHCNDRISNVAGNNDTVDISSAWQARCVAFRGLLKQKVAGTTHAREAIQAAVDATIAQSIAFQR
jgi:hypothetical protein